MNDVPEDKRPDFCLTIGFEKDTKNPSRIFKSMASLIEAIEGLDNILIESIDSKVKPVLLLESIETGSVKVWLRQFVEVINDDAIKNLKWQPLIGQYLVKAKYYLLEKLDPKDPLPTREKIDEISQGINAIAKETHVQTLPVYKLIPASEIARGIKLITDATSKLYQEDYVLFSSDDGDSSIPSSVVVDQSKINEVLANETIENTTTKILKVRRPDFLGDSAWEFRHEDRKYPARIEDTKWLEEFRDGLHAIRPGDALRVEIFETTSYDINGEVVIETRVIKRVLGIIRQHRPTLPI